MNDIPNSKFQVPKKFQAPDFKTVGECLDLEFWSFLGIWNLALGI
jgi:hypothetical protein